MTHLVDRQHFMGFRDGLAKVKPWVKVGGYVGISEAVWLQDNPPREVTDFWQAYPEIGSVPEKLEVIESLGFRDVGHFVLPGVSLGFRWTMV